MHEQSRMVRKQYHLSVQNVRRIESLRDQLGLDSEAELIRRAIDTFDPEALEPSDRELVENVADDLLARIHTLNENMTTTIDRAESARKRLADPEWVESIREHARQEAAGDPNLVAGVAKLIGA